MKALKLNTSSPTKSNISVNNSTRFETPTKVKAFVPFAGTPLKKTPSNSFFKAVSLTPVRPRETTTTSNGRDLAILHESKIFKKLLSAAKSKTDFERRDPILQNNNEPAHAFKSSIRRLASADRMSECRDENIKRARGTGEFNYIYNPPNQSPRVESIKTFVRAPPESEDENYKRLRKPVRHRSEFRRDPINEGEQPSTIGRRARKPQVEVDSIQKVFNDRKFLLPAERGNSKRGQVFQRTFTLGDLESPTAAGSKSARETVESPRRPLTALEEKMRGTMKGILEYENGPVFRQEVVTEKINRVLQTELPTIEELKPFARKSTLF